MNSILSFFYEWRDEVLASNQEANIATQVGEKYVIAEKSCHNFVSLNYGIQPMIPVIIFIFFVQFSEQ